MTRISKRSLALVASAATLAVGGGAVASAVDASPLDRGGRNAQAKQGKLLRAPVLKAAADYLGMQPGELRRALPGTSLAALAQARGKSVDGLKQAILGAFAARLDRAVTEGRITAAQRQERLAKLSERVDRFVQRVFPAAVPHGLKHAFGRVVVRQAAVYLALRPAELRRQVKGTSLAQLAQERGRTAAGLQAAIVAPFQARLDRLVAAGRITTAQRDAVLARLNERVARLIARVHA